MKDFYYDVQLFAGGRECGVTGAKAADAVPQITGEKAPAAGERGRRRDSFKKLIEGEFKAEYDENVQNILKKRLKGSEETMKKFEALAPALKVLEQRYGVSPGDAAALAEAVLNDKAGERDAEAGENARKERASRLYSRWLRESAALRGTYPGFDLAAQLQNEDFRELLQGGASMRAAYELANRDALMREAARDMEDKIARRILSGTARPREGGLSSQSSAVVKSDVAHMSKAARRDIICRVQSGEKISF